VRWSEKKGEQDVFSRGRERRTIRLRGKTGVGYVGSWQEDEQSNTMWASKKSDLIVKIPKKNTFSRHSGERIICKRTKGSKSREDFSVKWQKERKRGSFRGGQENELRRGHRRKKPKTQPALAGKEYERPLGEKALEERKTVPTSRQGRADREGKVIMGRLGPTVTEKEIGERNR